MMSFFWLVFISNNQDPNPFGIRWNRIGWMERRQRFFLLFLLFKICDRFFILFVGAGNKVSCVGRLRDKIDMVL